MNRLYRTYRALAILLLGCWLAVPGSAQDPVAATRLRFLGNAELPPMVWASNGNADGVAVELTYAAARKAGLDIRVEATDWAQAQQDVAQSRADALIQINPSPERMSVFDFSDPLLLSSFHIFRRAGDVGLNSLVALSGKRVGVEGGGYPFAYLKGYPDITVVVVPSWARGFQMLQSGEIDAVFVDRWVGEYEMFQHKVSNVVMVDPAVVTLESRIAVKKGNQQLLASINRGLRAIAADGTRQAILDKWKAQEVLYLTRESINRILLGAALTLTVVCLTVAAWLYRERKRLKFANAALSASIVRTTEAMQQAVQAQARASRLSAEQQVILDNPVIGIMTVRERVIQWTNPALDRMLGYAPGELVGQSTRIAYPSEQAFQSIGISAYEGLTRSASHRFEYELVRKDGSRFYADISGAPLPGAPGDVIWCFTDISERHVQEQKVLRMAFNDALTQLPNRALFMDRLTQALAASARNRQFGALMVLDLDNFKPLNDTHGHTVGDLLLQELAVRLKRAVRDVDTVARFGGDEFTVVVGALADNPSDAAQLAQAIAEKIRTELAQPFLLPQPGSAAGTTIDHHCTASIGVVLFYGEGVGPDELFRQADAAMYGAKAQGRNRVNFVSYL